MSDSIENINANTDGYVRQKSLILEILWELSRDDLQFIGMSMANRVTIIKAELDKRILGTGDVEGYLPAGSSPMAIMSEEEILGFIEQEASKIPDNQNEGVDNSHTEI